MPPRGRKMSDMQIYFDAYTDEQLEVFFQKLATSKWVQNQYFSLDKLRFDDIVGNLLAGGLKEKEALSKYYTVNVIQRKTFVDPIVKLPEIRLKDLCPECETNMVRFPVFQTEGVQLTVQCPTCSQAKLEQFRNKVAIALTNQLAIKIGVPKRFLASSFDLTGIKREHLSVLKDFKQGLYFFGESGCGKTHQLVSWLKFAMACGKTVEFIDWSEFLCKIRANSATYYEAVQQYKAYDVLFIDDFKVGTSYMEEYSYNFINELYKAERCAFFTSCTLPYQDQFAMRISQMTKQYEIHRI